MIYALIIFSAVLSYIVLVYLPRPFPRSMVILLWLFSILAAKAMDQFFGLPFFQLFNSPSYRIELIGLLTWLLYPSIGYLFVYFYHHWNLREIATPVYVFSMTLLATVFEKIAVTQGEPHVVYWSSEVAFLTYLIFHILQLLFFELLRNYYRHKHT